MTDTQHAEAAEPVPPAPEAAELDAARLEAAPVTPEVDAPVVPEIEHPIGPLRQSVLDHLIDTVDAGPQSVAQILAAMPVGTSRNTGESAIRRELDAGRIERTSPGYYVLAKPKPPAPSAPSKHALPPEPEPVRRDGITDEQWLAALEAFFADPASWDVEKFGPSPDNHGSHRIPPDVVMRMNERLRKRDERRRDAELAAARRAAADTELRNKLPQERHRRSPWSVPSPRRLPQNALATPPVMPESHPDDVVEASPGIAAESPAARPDDGAPVAAGRDALLAAFARNRTPPQPVAPQRQSTPQPRPPERQAESEAISDEVGKSSSLAPWRGWSIGTCAGLVQSRGNRDAVRRCRS